MNFADFELNGFGILENILDDEIVLRLKKKLANLKPSNSDSQRNETVYGVRNLLNLSLIVREFSVSEPVRKIAKNILGENAKIVRAIFFDKTADANWKVPWHQDLTIAVKEKRDAKGFSAWTRKAGIQHVQPPVEILEKMVTLRFHLDDADETNGALKVIPKSYKSGRLSAEEIKSRRQANEMRLCSVKKGDCLIMRPLILHASSAGTNPQNRRVVHLEFAAGDLPNGLDWYGS
jgi:ectoine hydroxylase-related dioxygenase (phytanoyl-CoA dioxygenase family)